MQLFAERVEVDTETSSGLPSSALYTTCQHRSGTEGRCVGTGTYQRVLLLHRTIHIQTDPCRGPLSRPLHLHLPAELQRPLNQGWRRVINEFVQEPNCRTVTRTNKQYRDTAIFCPSHCPHRSVSTSERFHNGQYTSSCNTALTKRIFPSKISWCVSAKAW